MRESKVGRSRSPSLAGANANLPLLLQRIANLVTSLIPQLGSLKKKILQRADGQETRYETKNNL